MTQADTLDYPTAQAPDMSDFDPFGMELRAAPFTLFPRLVENSPGFMMAEGTPSCFVASYADVTAVARDFKRFSSLKPVGLPGMERFDMFNSQPVMNYSDPPEHTRRRKVVQASFTPRRVEQIDVDSQGLVDRLLDNVAGKEVVNALEAICQPVATEMLLGGLMNVPPEDRPIFFRVMYGMSFLDKMRPGDAKPPEYVAGWAAGSDYCRKAIAKAREEKSETLVGLIVRAAEEMGVISDEEMLAMMMLLLTGGLTTVPAATASTLLCLAQRPDLRERVRQEPALADVALEEAMRLYSPVTFSMRFATVDAEIGGKTIPGGTPVYTLWSAANHDPAKFPDPYSFDLDRPNLKEHLAFGWGMHTCIGAAVTRNLGPMIVRKMLERFPNFRLADPDHPPPFNTGSARGTHLLNLPLILD